MADRFEIPNLQRVIRNLRHELLFPEQWSRPTAPEMLRQRIAAVEAKLNRLVAQAAVQPDRLAA